MDIILIFLGVGCAMALLVPIRYRFSMYWHDGTGLTSHKKPLREGYSRLYVYFSPGGELVIDGYDTGSFVAEFWGDDDYEYSLSVTSKNVKRILQVMYGAHIVWPIQLFIWCTPRLFHRLLLLRFLKVNFGSDSDFRDWLDKHNIDYEFWNWA